MPHGSAPRDPVLIVGGGPTGLTLAIELLRRGVPCRVIDRQECSMRTSRAASIHARTLELFEMAGYVDRFLERGLISESMDFRFQGDEEIARLDFTQLESRYAHILIITQSDTEQVLRDHFAALGGKVEWRTELQSAADDGSGRVTATLTNPDSGQVEVVHTSWLVGCDGLYSTVRAQLGMEFEGDQYTGLEMRMMDVPLDGFPYSDNRIHYFIGKERMLLITKLPGSNYRVMVSDMGDAPKTETARDAFQLVVDDHFDDKVTLGEPKWASVFKIWRRISTSYRRGNILLCGDAAHIHSPAGGQGMNACIQDAFNLGWKLAMIANGEARASLLDTYEQERRPIAEQVIEGSDLLHAVILAHGESLEERLAIAQAPGFKQRAVRQMSGLSYTYRDTLTAPQGLAPLDGLAAGDRAPDMDITGTLRVHDLLRHPSYTLLALQCQPQQESVLTALVDRISRRYGDRVRVVTLSSVGQGGAAPSDAIVVENDNIHLLYGLADGDALCLVRPDGYVGLRCRLSEQAALFAILETELT